MSTHLIPKETVYIVSLGTNASRNLPCSRKSLEVMVIMWHSGQTQARQRGLPSFINKICHRDTLYGYVLGSNGKSTTEDAPLHWEARWYCMQNCRLLHLPRHTVSRKYSAVNSFFWMQLTFNNFALSSFAMSSTQMKPLVARLFSVNCDPADGKGGHKIGGTGTVPFAV